MFAHHRLQSRTPTLRFGRRRPFTFAMAKTRQPLSLNEEVQLFLTTFAGGLLFMTVYLA